jgi:hypothetical protein
MHLASIVVKGVNSMNYNAEAALDIAAAIFILFVAMIDPLISAGLAIMFLIALSVYKFVHNDVGRR